MSEPVTGASSTKGSTWAIRTRSWLQRLVRQPITARDEPVPAEATAPTPVVELAAKIGSIALVTGASASDATAMMLRIGWTFGVRLQADVTYTSVIVGYTPGDGREPVTMIRVVPGLAQDFARLAHLRHTVDRIADGHLAVDQAHRELDRRTRQELTYRPWVTLVAAFAQGATICALLGGATLEVLVAGLATLLVDVATRRMARWGASYFFAQVAAGAIPMMLAALLMVLRQYGIDTLWALTPSLVVASGMVTMLAGLSLVSAAQDALDGYFLTATARIIELVMRTGGLILGVVVVLWIAVRMRLPVYLTPESLPPPDAWVQVLAAAGFALAFGVGTRLGPGGAVIASVIGASVYASYLLFMSFTAGSHVVSVGGGAVVAAVLGHTLGARLGFPPVALVTLGIASLMPGMMLYRALYWIVVGQAAVQPADSSGGLIMMAALSGLALAVGSSVGSVIGRQLILPTERIARRAVLAARGRGRVRD